MTSKESGSPALSSPLLGLVGAEGSSTLQTVSSPDRSGSNSSSTTSDASSGSSAATGVSISTQQAKLPVLAEEEIEEIPAQFSIHSEEEAEALPQFIPPPLGSLGPHTLRPDAAGEEDPITPFLIPQLPFGGGSNQQNELMEDNEETPFYYVSPF